MLLGALVVYPAVSTVGRSLGDAQGDFVGLANYRDLVTSERTRLALRNTAVWVVAAPLVVTGVGLVLAVAGERVRLGAAVRVAVFMPMAISFLAAGVIFRIAYDDDPDVGLVNAAIRPLAEAVSPPGPYPGARPAQQGRLRPDGDGFVTTQLLAPGEPLAVGLVGIRPSRVPERAAPAESSASPPGSLSGTVWLDFTRGGGGRRGVIDTGEVGLPGIRVETVPEAAAATTEADGSFQLQGLDPGRRYRLRLASSAFVPPFSGIAWLGPSLVTPAMIAAYVWIWAGFALVVIRAGLAALPREVLEAARVDGATEAQTFRRITLPLLAPVLVVVLLTLVLNVLKVFDLVLILAPGSVQAQANVLALEMWRVSFGAQADRGLGSALAVVLFASVVPVMVLNLRRLRRGTVSAGV